MTTTLAAVQRALVVVAHPDDESFGLGGVLDQLIRGGSEVWALCFTHGEASTLGGRPADLAGLRAAELDAAAGILGITHTELLGYPDMGLSDVAVAELAGHVELLAGELDPTHLVAFDTGGITGHPDHQQATRAAVAAGALLGVPVIGWALPAAVAKALNAEFGTAFVGRPPAEIDWTVPVDRGRQWKAIAAHASQSGDNPVLYRRLELSGTIEHLRALA